MKIKPSPGPGEPNRLDHISMQTTHVRNFSQSLFILRTPVWSPNHWRPSSVRKENKQNNLRKYDTFSGKGNSDGCDGRGPSSKQINARGCLSHDSIHALGAGPVLVWPPSTVLFLPEWCPLCHLALGKGTPFTSVGPYAPPRHRIWPLPRVDRNSTEHDFSIRRLPALSKVKENQTHLKRINDVNTDD